jgi:hypothetical protein
VVPGPTGRLIAVNGGTGALVTHDGTVMAIACVYAAGGLITEIDLVANPDKLQRFASPVS